MKYRKIPVEIEAVRWTGSNLSEMETFMGEKLQPELWSETAYVAGQGPPLFTITIETSEGSMKAMPGDYIIKEPFPTSDRKFYPCKSAIFQMTYELVQ